jgi:hypothetical protein
MSKRGVAKAAAKKMTQQINKQENKEYYQNQGAVKSPRSDNERKQHRTVVG